MSIDDLYKEIAELEQASKTIEYCILKSKQAYEECKDKGYETIWDLNRKRARLQKQLEDLEKYEGKG